MRAWLCSMRRSVTARLSAIRGLKADIVGAGRDRGFDAGGEQLLEQLEKAVLQRDAASASTRFRKVVIGGSSSRMAPSLVAEAKAGGVLEMLQGSKTPPRP